MPVKKLHFTDLTEYHDFLGLPAPENPMLSVTAVSSMQAEDTVLCDNENNEIRSDFYSISLKHIISGELFYGRTKYDCRNGTMIFTAPKQVIRTSGLKVETTGRSIFFHEDFIRGEPIKEDIKKYHYFSYAVNEALHLSPKEEQMITGIFDQLEQEYHNNHDAFSKELILSQLSTLLKYANRFYHRQFLHRKEASSDLKDRFLGEVDRYLEKDSGDAKTIPTIEELASALGITPRYLSDALKVETGKAAMENLHVHLIDKAKDLLLESDANVATIAYGLGFEYPQYFARLFKKKVGKTPTEYRNSHHLNKSS